MSALGPSNPTKLFHVNGASLLGGTTTVGGNLLPAIGSLMDIGTSSVKWRNLALSGTADIDSTLTLGGNIVKTGDLTVDVSGDILLDAGGADVRFLDDGADYFKFIKSGNNSVIKSQVADGDFILRGSDNGVDTDALTFDMSDAGTAIFNSDVRVHNGAALKAYRSGNSAYAALFMDTGEKLYIRNSWGTKDIVMLRTGEVGIGTAEPRCILSVSKAVTAGYEVEDCYLMLGGQEASAGSTRLIGFGYVHTTSTHPPANIGYLQNSNAGFTNGDLIFRTRETTTNVSPTERMRILSDGNVGIGTTAPSSKLEVYAADGDRTTLFKVQSGAAVDFRSRN